MLSAGAGRAGAGAANPYAPALTVNNGVITHYDIDQRMRLLDALGRQRRPARARGPAADRGPGQGCRPADDARHRAARRRDRRPGSRSSPPRRGLTVDDVLAGARGPRHRPADDGRLRRIRACSGARWSASRFRARAMPTEADLDAALELARDHAARDADARRDRPALRRARRGRDPGARRPALPRARRAAPASPPSAREYSRSATAAAGRRRSSRCRRRSCRRRFRTQVLLLRPGPGDPADPDLRRARDPQARLDPPGAARPERAAADDPAVREALRQQLFTERITSFGQGYLQELLGDALIVER